MINKENIRTQQLPLQPAMSQIFVLVLLAKMPIKIIQVACFSPQHFNVRGSQKWFHS